MARRSTTVAVIVGAIAFIVFAGLMIAVVLAVGDGGGLPFGEERIAIIEISGTITDPDEVLERIRELREAESVGGFVVAINSPGGGVGASQSIYRELKKLNALDERPMVASIRGVGASGGYYVALAADKIYALPGSITGSIGVIMMFPNVSELLDNIGVEVNIVKSAEFKAVGSPFVPLADQGREVLDNVVETVYGQFVRTVAEERGLPRERVLELADGRIYSGERALELGLVDAMGNLPAAIAAAGRMAGLGPDPEVGWPPEETPSLLDVLLGAEVANALSDLAARVEETTGPQLKYIVY